ncbi:MAG TPA: DUF202 domain-containing protein [Acidimicrobiales bacterium]|nr:DUF202 domain-containing protein [Acidimicrobiales bacterium]
MARDGDDSAAAERTMLAWSRFAVAAVTLGAVAVRTLPADRGARWLVGGLAAATGAVAELYGYRAHLRHPTIRTRGRAASLVSCAVATLAAGVLLLVV